MRRLLLLRENAVEEELSSDLRRRLLDDFDFESDFDFDFRLEDDDGVVSSAEVE